MAAGAAQKGKAGPGEVQARFVGRATEDLAHVFNVPARTTLFPPFLRCMVFESYKKRRIAEEDMGYAHLEPSYSACPAGRA